MPIVVQYNPQGYEVSNDVKYAEKSIPGQEGTIRQFVAGESPSLNISLMFDTYIPPSVDMPVEGGTDVTLLTRQIIKLTHIKGSLHRPPLVTFVWGTVTFQGIVSNVKQQFTMFLSSGMPVRAKLDVTIKAASQNSLLRMLSPLESPDRTKFRTVKEGEYLWNYALEEYGDAQMWRVIARENKILNPLDITPGQIIKLPAL